MSLVFKTLRWGALLCSLILLTTAFIPSDKAGGADLSCTVEVRNADGSAAKYVKVTTDVSGGVFCAGGRAYFRGKCQWQSNSLLGRWLQAYCCICKRR